jgi:hypothetical protein
VPQPPLHVQQQPRARAADHSERALDELRRVTHLRVREVVFLELLDLAEPVERERADLAVVVAVSGEVRALLVDDERLGLEHEGLLELPD